MLMIINKDIEALVNHVIADSLSEQARRNARQSLITIDDTKLTEEQRKKVLDAYHKGSTTVYHETYSVPYVSRETFTFTEEEIALLKDITSVVRNECGQISCEDCIYHAKNKRFNSTCLMNQLDELRRKYSY